MRGLLFSRTPVTLWNHMTYADQSVWVVGGAGFMGSFVVRELLRQGAQVTAVVRSETSLWRLEDIRARVTVLPCDFFDRTALTEAMMHARPVVVFNLAAFVRTTQTMELMDTMIAANVATAHNLLHAAAAAHVSRFVQTGTIEEYGHTAVPFREDVREQPISPYSVSKVMATHLALLYHRLGALSVTVVRPAATFGPMQGPGMLTPNLIQACKDRRDFDMNPGEQMRDLLFVEDAARGIVAAGAHPAAAGEIMNIGTTVQHRIRDVVERIVSLMGNPITVHFGAVPYRPLDTPAFYMDVSKAERLLGWRATTPFDEAMARTVAWYRDHTSFT